MKSGPRRRMSVGAGGHRARDRRIWLERPPIRCASGGVRCTGGSCDGCARNVHQMAVAARETEKVVRADTWDMPVALDPKEADYAKKTGAPLKPME